MNVLPVESREVPVDVLPPLPADAAVGTGLVPETKPPFADLKSFYHPASGVAILGIDILCFGPQVFFPFDVPVMCALAFLATFPLVYFFQLKWSKNTPQAAFGKAFLGAFLAGLPFSIAGTMFGAAVIALSGLPGHPIDILKRITASKPKLTQ
jgi:hypothetical protein